MSENDCIAPLSRLTLDAARFLVVDDEPGNVLLLKRLLELNGYVHIVTEIDPRAVAGHCESFQPDIILLDLMMPNLDGFGVLAAIQPYLQSQTYLPVLVLTADSSPGAKRRALAEGARDFLIKPFDHEEVMLRVRNLLETRFLYQRLGQQNATLESRVRERTSELERSRREVEESQQEVLQRLAQAAEFRDDDTGQHTQRVGEMAAELARAAGLDPQHVSLIRRASPLHDVGKIGISDTILLKPGKLTEDEFETMKMHTLIGGTMLADGHSSLVHLAHNIALSHHERWNGTGYPRGLGEDEIPIEGRILSIVDVYDALTNERPYKKAWPRERAAEEIMKGAGTQFDPQLAAQFMRVIGHS
jgi:putative two-component system response regulator